MIGRLRGLVADKEEDSAIIEAGDVGYHVYLPLRILDGLEIGQSTNLVIETHVREDHIHLFGFTDKEGREWFRLLTSVQRVGAKMAMTILGSATPEQLTQHILAKDIRALSQFSGVGAKLAERLVSELRDKVEKMPASSVIHFPSPQSHPPHNHIHEHEAMLALVRLGYQRIEAQRILQQATKDLGDDAPIDILLKTALKLLAVGS